MSTCACGCGASLAGMRADAVYASEACSKRARRSDSPDKARTQHPLADARAEQEATKLNASLGHLVRQAIVHQLETKGRVHADDLEPHFPAEHVKRCRKLTGAQFGQLAGRHYILGVEYRKSTVPERKASKSWVYVFTDLGREKLVGVGSDNGEGTADAQLRSMSTLDRPAPDLNGDSPGAPSSGAADPGEPTSLFDESVGKARPRSAITEAEAA